MGFSTFREEKVGIKPPYNTVNIKRQIITNLQSFQSCYFIETGVQVFKEYLSKKKKRGRQDCFSVMRSCSAPQTFHHVNHIVDAYWTRPIT